MQCSIAPGHKAGRGPDHGDMKKFDALSQSLLALAVAAMPAAAVMLDQLDQSMRRPSLAGVVLHSLRLAI